jgi:hypothetical protein
MITTLIYLAGLGDDDGWWDVEIGICD